MQLKLYAKDKVVTIGLYLLYCLLLFILIDLITGNLYAAFFLTLILSVFFWSCFFYDYIKRRNFYHRLAQMYAELDQKTLIDQLLPDGGFLEATILKEILSGTSKYMNDEIQKYKLISKEYREYIELWIHEVKTPIASAKLILENHPTENTESLMEETEQIERYVEQALYYARSNSVEKDYMIKECSLTELTGNVVRRLRKEFIYEKIELKLKLTSDTVFTDEKWTEFILLQILGNSIKYRSKQAVIEIFSQTEENQVILTIRDNGIGIAPASLPRIFEKGFTGETGRQYTKATGMGLYLAKKLCDKLALGLEVDSKEGEGTTVRIIFPADEISILKQ